MTRKEWVGHAERIAIRFRKVPAFRVLLQSSDSFLISAWTVGGSSMLAPDLKKGRIGEERLGPTTDMLSIDHWRKTKDGGQDFGLLTLRSLKPKNDSDFNMDGV